MTPDEKRRLASRHGQARAGQNRAPARGSSKRGLELFPPEVKRQLTTLEAATGRAIGLSRQIIQRRCYRPPDLDAVACIAEVTMFDLRPFTDVAWTLGDGTKVWITEAEQPLPLDWS